ncbi:MAG: DNA mismatch repair protein MutS [Terriglobales bacterium]
MSASPSEPAPPPDPTGARAPATPPETPLMRQYWGVKRQYPEALLLFRLGDFYELFYADAVTAARELEITLTARNKEKGVPIPMCGVPYHAAQNYIARLIQKGYKVAICDQMEDAKLAKKLVKREITRVLTPGTAAAQRGEEVRYLAAVAPGPAAVGLALLEVSTGEFRVTECSGPAAAAELRQEVERWRPREILHPSQLPPLSGPLPAETALTPLEDWIFAADFARRELETHFGVATLDGLGLAAHPWAASAAAAIVHYVKETQRSRLEHVDRLTFYHARQGLVLDAPTIRNLELVEPVFAGEEAATLRHALDQTLTPMGRRLLRAWLLSPIADRAALEARHDAVAALLVPAGPPAPPAARAEAATAASPAVAAPLPPGPKPSTPGPDLAALRGGLAGILDLERLLSRATLATANPRDLRALAASLERIPSVAAALGDAAGGRLVAGRLAPLAAELDPLAALRDQITATLREEPPATTAEGGYIRGGVSPELDELRALGHGGKQALAAIEQREREATGIASLKVRFNNIFGYYLEVSRSNLHRIPPHYERKQTLVNAERFTLPELKELELKVLTAEELARELEAQLFAALRQKVAAAGAAIRRNAAALAELDVLANFAHLAHQRRYCRPQWSEDGVLEIRGGRHAVVELAAWEPGADRFVPNDTYMDDEQHRVLVLTGPNMGGKSTYLRQVALIALLAQVGSFVPADSARLPIVDRIFTRIGAGDNLSRGRSTFMVEMTETAAILNGLTARSLVILDEIGRGTATYDGLALAWAIIEHLHAARGAKTLFATHYHELTELADHLPGVRNCRVSVAEAGREIVFLRRVEPGAADRSYGLEVARLAGLPAEVMARARQVLGRHERAERRTSGELAPEPPEVQLTLFTPISQKIAARLAAVDLNRLTPLEAMQLLAELQADLSAQP